MCEKTLNITNGECFNTYFISKFNGVAVPFCEAMMDGEVAETIFSQQFIALRAKSLNVTEDEYKSKMHVPTVLNQNAYQSLALWFGNDTFCQMNLLTLLAYLEQIQYRGVIKLNYIDDETFEILQSNIDVSLGIYNQIYKDILILKQTPQNIGVLKATAIELYFDYLSNNGTLANLVKENANKSKIELIGLLLNQSKDYGLSDVQAERLINSHLSV